MCSHYSCSANTVVVVVVTLYGYSWVVTLNEHFVRLLFLCVQATKYAENLTGPWYHG